VSVESLYLLSVLRLGLLVVALVTVQVRIMVKVRVMIRHKLSCRFIASRRASC